MSRLLLPLVLLALAGCQHYEVEITLDADGGGSRSVELRGDVPGPTPETSASRLRLGFSLDESAGWRQVASEDDPRRLVFRRERRVSAAGDWPSFDGEIAIPGRAGALPADGDVLLSNQVEVQLDETPGRRSLSYRERFTWSGILPAASGIVADVVTAALEDAIEGLNPLERAELHGLAAGAAQRYLALEQAESSEAAYHTFVGALATQMHAVLAPGHPALTTTRLASLLDGVLGESSEAGDAAFEALLPGADLVATSDLTLHLTLPGPVLESNADSVDGNRATWRFGLSQALLEPVQLYARTEFTP